MKHLILYLLCAMLLFCIVLTGCTAENDSEPLRVCLDIGTPFIETGQLETSVQSFVSDLKEYAQAYGGPSEVSVEIIPSGSDQQEERKATLQRIRTEVAAGGGPDVFISSCEGIGYSRMDSTRLFPYVEKAISNGYFLPMDDYMANAQFTDFNSLFSKVMDGGKNKDGNQVVLPISFSVPVTIYRELDVDSNPSDGIEWSACLDTNDPTLLQQVRWLWPELDTEGTSMGFHDSLLGYLYPKIVDCEKEELTLTEEDLFNLVKQGIKATKSYFQQDNAPDNYALLLDRNLSGDPTFLNFFNSQEPVRLVPLANLSGGTTAKISTYCAINSCTKKERDAFFVIDLLLSDGYQKSGFISISGALDEGRMPTSKKLLSPGNGLRMLEFTQQQHDEWMETCELINSVHFHSPLENELGDMMKEIQQVMADSYEPDPQNDYNRQMRDIVEGDISDEQLHEIIHQHYEYMCRLVDES